MGLDSYLYIKKEHKTDTLRNILNLAKTNKQLQETLSKEDLDSLEELSQTAYIDTVQEIAYWRKANQIHNYFIQECGGGEDNGQSIYVCLADLKELVRRCKKIIKTVQYTEDWIHNGTLFGSDDKEIFYLDDDTQLPLEEIKKLIQQNDPRITVQKDDGSPFFTLWRNKEHTEKADCFLNSDNRTRIEYYILGKTISNTELAEELLPTTSGFFFGSTEYNEYYIQDLEDTIKQLEPIIKKEHSPFTSFRYEASW